MSDAFKKPSLWRGMFKLCADTMTIPFYYPIAGMKMRGIAGAMPGFGVLDNAASGKAEAAGFGLVMAWMCVGGAIGLAVGTVLAGAVVVDNLVEYIYRMAKGETVSRGWLENELLDKKEPSRFMAIMDGVQIPTACYG